MSWNTVRSVLNHAQYKFYSFDRIILFFFHRSRDVLQLMKVVYSNVVLNCFSIKILLTLISFSEVLFLFKVKEINKLIFKFYLNL